MEAPRRARVVVIGAGAAGLAAAASALDAGADVLLLDKEPRAGGNSAKASTGINAVLTEPQLAAGVTDDSPARLLTDTLSSGKGFADPTLARTLAVNAHDAILKLNSDGAGLENVVLAGGHSRRRTHRPGPHAGAPPAPAGTPPPKPAGISIVAALRARLDAASARAGAGHLEQRFGVRVTRLLQDAAPSAAADEARAPGAVAGVELEAVAAPLEGGSDGAAGPAPRIEERADAVVLATGGFGADRTPDGLLARFAPQLAALPTTNGAWTTGDGIRLAAEAGASLRHMNFVQVHPTGLLPLALEGGAGPRAAALPGSAVPGSVWLGPEALRGCGGILLDARGRRFVNELSTRDVVTAAILAQGVPLGARPAAAGVVQPHGAYLVLPPRAAEGFGLGTLGFYAAKGYVREVAGAAGLAALLGADAEAVVEALEG
jgi:glycine/D-amino acid oxidase-like deaminating enzyme